MQAGIISLIILAIVGILKLPFGTFKQKHPKSYRATITLATLILIVISVIINQLYIVEQPLRTYDTLILLFAVVTGVFITYNGIYEGLALKQLFSKLSENIKRLKEKNPENKLTKLVNKLGVESSINIINLMDEEKKKAEDKNEIELKEQ